MPHAKAGSKWIRDLTVKGKIYELKNCMGIPRDVLQD